MLNEFKLRTFINDLVQSKQSALQVWPCAKPDHRTLQIVWVNILQRDDQIDM